MKDKLIPKKTLGPVSATLVYELQKQDKNVFTLADASILYGKTRPQTARFLSGLIKRGILSRIKSGAYLILQSGQENTQLSSWPVIAHVLAKPDDYFISHYSAMRIHGMTTHPLLDIYITMYKRHRIKKIANITHHFVFAKREHFWGSHPYWVTKNNKVYVSDIERTLLDGLERPDLCGGIKEVTRGIWSKRNEINWEKMLHYAAKFRTKATIQRLGFLLELLELGVEHIHLLKEITLSAKGYVLLDPNGLPQGKHQTQWHIQLNIDIQELKASIWG